MYDVTYLDLSQTEDLQSLIECNKNKEENTSFNFFKRRSNQKSVQVTEAKSMPAGFFILFILIVSVMLFKFVPNYYQSPKLKNGKSKFLNCFSGYLYELDKTLKVGNFFTLDSIDSQSNNFISGCLLLYLPQKT